MRNNNAGDTLVVVRLDRLARSVSHLLEVIEDFAARVFENGDLEALAKVTAAQEAAYGERVQATANQRLPTGRRMRPDHAWDDVARLLKQRGFGWTPERLHRVVKWMVGEGMADAALFRKSPPRLPEERLMTLVAGIHSSNPELTLREITGQLERLHERMPHGGSKSSPSSLKHLIDRARR